MNREALLLYLQNIRDLEVARYFLNRKYQMEKRNRQQQVEKLKFVKYVQVPEQPKKNDGVSIVVIGFIFAALCLYATYGSFSLAGSASGIAGLMNFIGWILLISFLVIIIATIVHIDTLKNDYERRKKAYEDALFYNSQEQKRHEKNKQKIASLNRTWYQYEDWYQGELKKIEPILNDFYSMNIIPKRFRNVSAMCYIYEYMSTSQESLSMALLDQHLEDGIRRIENKLNTIISDLTDLIYETRCLRQDSQQIIEQNKKNIDQNNHMLESLQRTEQNTLQAAQYAELSADYSKANAYFSLATYLKN